MRHTGHAGSPSVGGGSRQPNGGPVKLRFGVRNLDASADDDDDPTTVEGS